MFSPKIWLSVFFVSLVLWVTPTVVLAQEESQPEWLEISLDIWEAGNCELPGKPEVVEADQTVPALVFPPSCQVNLEIILTNLGEDEALMGLYTIHVFDPIYFIPCLGDGSNFWATTSSVEVCHGINDFEPPLRDTSTQIHIMSEEYYGIPMLPGEVKTFDLVYLTGTWEGSWDIEVCVYGQPAIQTQVCKNIEFVIKTQAPTAEEPVDQPDQLDQLFLPFMSS